MEGQSEFYALNATAVGRIAGQSCPERVAYYLWNVGSSAEQRIILVAHQVGNIEILAVFIQHTFNLHPTNRQDRQGRER